MPRSRASEMVGSAVLVTLPSSADRSNGIQIAVKERQKPGPRTHFMEGVREGWDGGSGGRVFSELARIRRDPGK